MVVDEEEDDDDDDDDDDEDDDDKEFLVSSFCMSSATLASPRATSFLMVGHLKKG